MKDFTENQKKCLAYFKENLPEWLKDELKVNKHVVIQDESVKGIFDTFGAAVDFAFRKYAQGDFIIQHIFDEDRAVSYLRMAV